MYFVFDLCGSYLLCLKHCAQFSASFLWKPKMQILWLWFDSQAWNFLRWSRQWLDVDPRNVTLIWFWHQIVHFKKIASVLNWQSEALKCIFCTLSLPNSFANTGVGLKIMTNIELRSLDLHDTLQSSTIFWKCSANVVLSWIERRHSSSILDSIISIYQTGVSDETWC